MSTELDMAGRQISDDEAWELCEAVGKSAPYAGYGVKLNDGRFVFCKRDDSTAHKTVYFVRVLRD